MEQKYFEIKLYDFAWNFRKQITKTSSEISFSENINWVQGQLNLEVFWEPEDFYSTDIVEIRETYEGQWFRNYYWDDSKFWDDSDFWKEKDIYVFPIYTWIIETVWFVEYENYSKIDLRILWVWTALNDIIYKNWTEKKFTKTWTAWEIAKDIIDYFNSQYWSLTETQNLWDTMFFYSTESIDILWDDISVEFDNLDCFRSLDKLTEDTGFYFFIQPTGLVNFRKTKAPKILTFKKEIVQIINRRKKDEMVNKLYITRDWEVEKVYTNTTSITDYNLKEKVETRSEIKDEATQDIIWAEKVNEFWEERLETEIEIKEQRNNFLYPWDFISTQNTKTQIINKRVEKIDKRTDIWTLYLWDYTSFWKTIVSQGQKK